LTARSIVPRLLASVTAMAALTLTVAASSASAQVHPRSDCPASQIQVQADAAAIVDLGVVPRADTAVSHRPATARTSGWIAGVYRLAAALAWIAWLVRG